MLLDPGHYHRWNALTIAAIFVGLALIWFGGR
jgi:hypothetical protein